MQRKVRRSNYYYEKEDEDFYDRNIRQHSAQKIGKGYIAEKRRKILCNL